MKRGEITIGTIVELIIGIASVALLIFVMISYFTPGYNQTREISKSYSDRLEGDLEAVYKGDRVEFILFNIDRDVDFYLVYFEKVKSFNFDDKNFVTSESGDKVVCSCYSVYNNAVCKYCFDSDLPLSFDGYVSGGQVFVEGDVFDISLKEGYYEFTKR